MDAILKALPEQERVLFQRFVGSTRCAYEGPYPEGSPVETSKADSQRHANARLLAMLQQALLARARAAPVTRAWTINMLFPHGV